MRGLVETAPRRRWTPDDDALLRARYAHEPTAALAADLGRQVSAVYRRADILGLKKSDAYLASPAAGRTNGRQGMGTRFQPGSVPPNKGLRRPGWGPGRMRETQFRKGERRGKAAQNWNPIGTILRDSDGYQRIKVREARYGHEPTGFGNTKVWPLLGRHLWAEAHGPIPPRHAVTFKDGNRANCVLDNLELVSCAELMRRNSVHNLPAPLPQVIQLLGAVKRQIRKRDGQKQA